jgi:hypothetical protein
MFLFNFDFGFKNPKPHPKSKFFWVPVSVYHISLIYSQAVSFNFMKNRLKFRLFPFGMGSNGSPGGFHSFPSFLNKRHAKC